MRSIFQTSLPRAFLQRTNVYVLFTCIQSKEIMESVLSQNCLQMTRTKLMAGVVCFTAIASVFGSHAPIRLQDGNDPYQGRLEVFYQGEWGTVCDDGWTDTQCQVVCRQLNMTEGIINKQATSVYGQGSGRIWLDDVVCDGDELYLTECPSSHWGTHNCGHTEDVGCICQPATASNSGCNSSRHRINPFHPSYPGIGRVEVQDDAGFWWTVCDDFWDDVDAAVLCDCLGYTQRQHFRAYWSRELINMAPPLPILYEAMFCGVEHIQHTHNLWDCPNRLSGGTDTCDSSQEAAAVACQAVPTQPAPVAPVVRILCEADLMQVCFESSEYRLVAEHLLLVPDCDAPGSDAFNTTHGTCVTIPMDQCASSLTLTDSSYKHYCYNVTYSQYDTDPATLMFDSVWSRHACCLHHKNGSVDAMFLPAIPSARPVFSIGPQVDLRLHCYNDSLFSNELFFPSSVVRGDTVYCRVTADLWDNMMMLVVPDCYFSADNYPGAPRFTFHQDKCPTTDVMDLSYFNFDHHNWGFKFIVPKFQGYSDLYLTCQAFVCDYEHDGKPGCDRSCKVTKRRRRYSTANNHLTDVVDGPFLLVDHGFGPLILNNGSITRVSSTGNSEVEVVSGILRSASQQHLLSISVIIILLASLFS